MLPIKAASLLCIATLLAGYSLATQASPQQSSPAAIDSSALAQVSEQEAVDLLISALTDLQVADLDCLRFTSESENFEGSKAESWEFAAVEIHGGQCSGDPSVSHVRDRYKVSSNGEIAVLDIASGEYKTL